MHRGALLSTNTQLGTFFFKTGKGLRKQKHISTLALVTVHISPSFPLSSGGPLGGRQCLASMLHERRVGSGVSVPIQYQPDTGDTNSL